MYDDFIAGWLAGAGGLVIGHPMDTVKARIQTMKNYGGIFDCFKQTMKNETILGLYKGMFAPFVSVGLLHSLLFAGYGVTLRLLHPDEPNIESRKDLPMREIFLASFVGCGVQLIPAIPVELIKTKLQVQTENPKSILLSKTSGKPLYNGPFDCGVKLVKNGGIRALYQGGLPMAWRDCIGYIFYIPVYEYLYRWLRRYELNDVVAQLLAGGTAGSTSWWVICPFETVKNRVQTMDVHHHQHRPKHLWPFVVDIYRSEGIRAFYRGGLLLVCRGFPVNAVIFCVYAKTVGFLEDLRKK